jgi:hypothetical protein
MSKPDSSIIALQVDSLIIANRAIRLLGGGRS